MPNYTYTHNGVTYTGSGGYLCTEFESGVKLYDYSWWWAHPLFLKSCEEAGVPMKTYRHLASWFAANLEEIKGSDYYHFMVDNAYEILRIVDGKVILKAPATYDLLKRRETGTGVLPDFVLVGEEVVNRVFNGNTEQSVVNFNDCIVRMEHTERLSKPYYTFSERSPARALPNVGPEFQKVMNYTWKPDYTFIRDSRDYPNEPVFFGLELELSSRLKPIEWQFIVTQVEPRQEVFFYFKSDSSITGSLSNKYEMVTMPMTVRAMKKNFTMLFKKLEKLCEEKGVALSDVVDTSEDLTNGIHIHIGKNAFAQFSASHKGHTNRFVTIMNQWNPTFLGFLQRLAKRPQSYIGHRYCGVHPGLDGYKVSRRVTRGASCRERHAMCHDADSTVEVRVFYGLPTLQHILTCIEFTHAMLEFSRSVPLSYIDQPHFVERFSEWVAKARGFINLKKELETCV